MAAASIPTTSGIETNSIGNNQDENARHPTVEELLIQIENHLYKSIEHRASLLIAVWSCLAGKIGYFRNMEKVFHMLYRESAMTIFCGHWPKINLLFKRGLSRALIHFSHSVGHFIKGAEGLCSALVMAAYDPWGDPVIHKLISKEDIDQQLVDDFIKSEPFELLVIRVECLVNARFEDAAIRLCRCCLKSQLFHRNCEEEDDKAMDDNWRWTFMEWLFRLLFRKGRLNDLVAESGSCSCHDGVRLIYRTRSSPLDDSEPLTETLINLFLVRDLLFQSNYCCTSELMSLWCDFQVQKQRSVSEIQDAAHKLLVGHASSSAQFYLFVDILWGKFGASLLPLYIEMYVRGLTSDLNYLEAARQADNKENVIEIENHMAAMYFKLATMFNSINKEISLECMLSSFSLDPTKERLDWIKKLSLQISKEKALKAVNSKNELCKHKLCNKSGCAYPHPVIAKKKSVVMCDQAIQVGDESFDTEIGLEMPLNYSINNNSDQTAGSIMSFTHCESNPHMKQFKDKISDDISRKTNEVEQNEQIKQNCHSDSCEKNKNQQHSLIALSESSKPENAVSEKVHNECKSSSEFPEDSNKINCDSNEKQVLQSNLDIKACENHCSSDNLSANFVPHNGEICELSKESEKADDVNCKSTKIANDSRACNLANCEDQKAEHTSKIHKSHNHKESHKDTHSNHKVNENGFEPHLESDNSTSHSKKKSKNFEQNDSSKGIDDTEVQSNKICNGFEEPNESGIADEHNLHSVEHGNKNIEKIDETDKNSKTICLSKNSVTFADSKPTDNTSKVPLSGTVESECSESNINNSSEDAKHNGECMLKSKIGVNEKSLPAVQDYEDIIIKPFSHIVLDSKFAGLSEDVLSDFVIILESLRNKQLKSSNKWSQIKHLCEDYLENVTNTRCMMLNMQLNGSVDSEADSTSDVTAGVFKGFESHQSDDSVIEDHCADKSHVFKRFMHTDKNMEMATYVNLSDIHCPQIPLEKLFCTERSSSHLAHKKRHKKHRNHDKNPEKVVLRKLRHGSRAEHELVKRKKRKKRKGKRAKAHVKKHHSPHGKTNKNCLKTKKKKHKLKKKKEERNSGFISGDYCSDFSSAELMRLVKEHSHSYSKLPATTSKHPHSVGSSSDEPVRKKRKVSFDKKKQKTGKYHDKHKHIKSKSSKRKKKLAAIESCPGAVKNITDHPIHGNLDSVKDYSRIVQYSSVKKMEAVQIRQRSVALNLSEVAKVRQEQENRNTLVDPCASNSQLQHLVHQNFETSEDIMKMQLLMAQQQPEVIPISSSNRDFIPPTNNQAVLKYVCSKMTSHLLSVAQSSNCVSPDPESQTAPLPAHSNRTLHSQNSNVQPQNLTSNVKRVIIENMPYKLSSSNSSLAGTTIIPVSNLSTSTTDSRNLMGTVFSGAITYPATATSPQMTAFTIPVAHNPAGTKLVTSKIVIPINQCGNIRTTAPTAVALPDSETHTLASTSSNPPISGVIIVKNGNNTQIISGVQQPSSVLPCLSGTRVTLPYNRSRPSPVVSKTVPKIIKQAAKKLSQPIAKKPVIKPVIAAKPVPSSTVVSHDPVVAASLLSRKESDTNESEVITTSNSNILDATTDSSKIVKDSSVSEEISEAAKETVTASGELTVSPPLPDENTIQCSSDKNDTADDLAESSIPESNEGTPISVTDSPKPATGPSSGKDESLPAPDVPLKQSITPDSSKDEELAASKPPVEDKIIESEIEVTPEFAPEAEIKENKDKSSSEPPSEVHEEVLALNKSSDVPSQVEVAAAEIPSPVHLDEKEEEISPSVPIEEPETPKNEGENAISGHLPATIEESKNLPQADENNAIKVMSARRTDHSPIKAMNLSASNQEKQLQPINDGEISSDKTSPKASPKASRNKTDGTNQTSEAPTRSFTSISDAVRFSLMDMDDATDSVENQVVLQAFQASHASSPASPTYAASESGEERNSASPSSAVMLSAPQSTNTTELNVSRVSQRFETPVHCSQSEKFPECQTTVSRTSSWILEDTITEASSAVAVQKSPDMDSCGEGKDDDKPKKKRKKKERVDNDITHKFWCQICSKGFFSAYNLRRHCRNVHKMVLPKGTSDVPFANSSQCLPHVQQADTTTSETSSSRLSYGNVQTSCVSPNKGSEYSMLSPTHDTKTQEFSVKTGQHVPQIQSAEFQMQTPPRMSSQSSSTHVSPVTPPKDFRLGTPTSVPSPQISQNKMSPVKSPSQSKFQRLPTGSQVPQMAKMSQMQQIALCGQQALQQQRQISQLQSPGLIQPLPSVACQAQQMQASQCPHFQANKQIVQQRIGQLQLMHHVAQLPTVPHAAHGIQKPSQSQSFKKCTANQPASKMSENEQMQQAAQIAQNQQLLANQQMQKLIQIRQNAIAASGIASQLSLANAIPSVPGSPVKGASQCFQSQLAAARQAAVVGQIPTAQRAQGTSYNLPSHDTSSHQFFSPGVQPSQDQTSCPHSSFSAQNISEFSSNTPSYPTIRLSSEANDGLEDLEQFLLENMPWSGDQSSAHGLAQQSGNRPSSADSLTLSIPSQASTTSQNRGVGTSKGKASISRPKPRKPVATTPCSKNLLGNLGRGVKKKSCSKKTSKSSDTECTVSKPEVFPQANLVQQSHELKTFNKDAMGNMPNFSKQTVKNSSVGVLNETDSSDSVQCINVTHNAPPKNASVGINFNIFSPVGLCTSEKSTDLLCNPSSCKEVYDGQRKSSSSFLDHSNLVGTSSSNLEQTKSTMNMNQCETNPINMGSAFNPTGKSSGTPMKPFCPAAVPSPYGITNETPNPQDIFLGQRNSETSDSNSSVQKDQKNESDSSNLNSSSLVTGTVSQNSQVPELSMEKSQIEKNLFLGGNTPGSEENSELPLVEKETSEIAKDEQMCDTDHNSSVSGDITETKAITSLNSDEISLEPSTKTCTDNDDKELNEDISNAPKPDVEESKEEDSELDKNNFDNNDENNNDDNTVIKEECKENQTLSPKSDIMNDTSNTVLKNATEEKSFVPKVLDHDEHSSHEDTILNDENHLPKKNDLENIGSEIGLNRIALRVRKPQDASNKLVENDKNVQYFVSEKDDVKNQVIKKSSKKKKVKQENRKNENIISDTKIGFKLDSDAKIQKTGLLNNVNKEKDINRSLCMITSCYDGIKKSNSIENETNGDNFILDDKQLEEGSIDGIPAARLRLRDTPKTSVKRVCPCCVDSKMPKKCRANGGGNIAKIIGTKVSNNLKNKSTLKTRNSTNGHNGKINTRSSQRLRSRNNAIS